MKIMIGFRLTAIWLLAFFFNNFAIAGEKYLVDEGKSNLIITGTSTLHDWEMDVLAFNVSTELVFEEGSLKEINSINFKCFVEDIKSESKMMDNKAYKAFKEDDNPEIHFLFGNPSGYMPEEGGTGTVFGALSMAGTTKEINLPYSVIDYDEQGFTIQGELELKMTDFGMETPTFLAGAFKTGDRVKLIYDFYFVKEDNLTFSIKP